MSSIVTRRQASSFAKHQCLSRGCAYYQVKDGLCSEHAGLIDPNAAEKRATRLVDAFMEKCGHMRKDVHGELRERLKSVVVAGSVSMTRIAWREMYLMATMDGLVYMPIADVHALAQFINMKMCVLSDRDRTWLHCMLLSMCFEPWRSDSFLIDNLSRCYMGNMNAVPESEFVVSQLLANVTKTMFNACYPLE